MDLLWIGWDYSILNGAHRFSILLMTFFFQVFIMILVQTTIVVIFTTGHFFFLDYFHDFFHVEPLGGVDQDAIGTNIGVFVLMMFQKYPAWRSFFSRIQMHECNNLWYSLSSLLRLELTLSWCTHHNRMPLESSW